MRGTAHCTVTGCRQGPTSRQANARWPDGQLTPCYIRVRLKKPLKIGSIRVAKLSVALETRAGAVRVFGIDTSVTAIVAASDLTDRWNRQLAGHCRQGHSAPGLDRTP